MNIELVIDDARSKIIKLKDNSDVAKFVEPVCMNVEKNKKWSNTEMNRSLHQYQIF